VNVAPVLIRLPNHVGDACMALPAMRALIDAGCECTLVGRSWGASLFAALGRPYVAIKGTWFADRQRVHEGRRAAGGDVRGVLLPNSIGSALLFSAAGVPCAGLATAGRSALLRWPIAEPAACHEVERFYAVARGALAAWSLPAPAALPRSLGLTVTGDQMQAAQRLLAEHAIGRYALLSPVATGLHHGQPKHWAHFAQLVPQLQLRGLQTVAAPPATESAAVRAALPGATLLPPVALGVYAALAAGAALVIANDSGSSHVAAAVGARQVTIFGVTERTRTGPWSDRAICVGALGAWPRVAEVVAAIDQALGMP
jgi:heptosyltransferase-2